MADGPEVSGRTPLEGEAYHTQHEIEAFNERAEVIGDYAELVQTAQEGVAQEIAETRGPDAAVRRAWLWSEHRWLEALLFLLLVGLVALVAAFYLSGDDRTQGLDGGSSTETQAGESGAEDQASEDAATDDATDDGATDGADSPAVGGDPAAGATADVAYLLDLAAEVVAKTQAANGACAADDKGAAAEQIMAIKALMTEYIQADGDLVMPDFSDAQNAWLLAANSYVSGNGGALAEMQAAYGEMAAALASYEAAAGGAD